MKFEEHCQECIDELGKPYEEVHKWLDEFAGRSPWGMKHRCFRHHLQGAIEAEELFGHGAKEAALLHIKSDLRLLEGWNETHKFPRDANEYVKMGFF